MKTNFKERLIKSIAYSSLILGLASASVHTVSASPEDNSDEVDIVQLIEEQEISITELIELLKIKEEDAMVLSSKLEEKEVEISDNQKEIDNKNEDINKMETVISDVEKELNEKIKIYDDNVSLAAERAVQLQKENPGKNSMIIDTFLQAENVLDMLHRLHTIGILLDAHDKQIANLDEQAEEIKDTKVKLIKDKRAIVKDRQKLHALQLELNEEKSGLDNQASDLVTIIDELNNEKKAIEESYNGNLDELFQLQETQSGVQLYNDMQRMEAMRSEDSTGISTSSANSLKSTLDDIRSKGVNQNMAIQVVEEAHKYLGIPYVWGGSNRSGIDCSGLTQSVYASVGIKLPRVSRQQAKLGTDVPLSQAQPGDLLYWNRAGQTYHVAIYIGGGNYIHAPRPGKSVSITSVKHFTPTGARRILPEESRELSTAQGSAKNIKKGDLIGEFSATSYAVGGWAVPGTVTANGTDISNTIHTKDGHRIIAVDPKVIPMNSIVVVEIPGQEPFTAKASDTGGAIKGNIIDLLMGSPAESRKFGRKHGLKIYKY